MKTVFCLGKSLVCVNGLKPFTHFFDNSCYTWMVMRLRAISRLFLPLYCTNRAFMFFIVALIGGNYIPSRPHMCVSSPFFCFCQKENLDSQCVCRLPRRSHGSVWNTGSLDVQGKRVEVYKQASLENLLYFTEECPNKRCVFSPSCGKLAKQISVFPVGTKRLRTVSGDSGKALQIILCAYTALTFVSTEFRENDDTSRMGIARCGRGLPQRRLVQTKCVIHGRAPLFC